MELYGISLNALRRYLNDRGCIEVRVLNMPAMNSSAWNFSAV
jgi:hypothetical protein